MQADGQCLHTCALTAVICVFQNLCISLAGSLDPLATASPAHPSSWHFLLCFLDCCFAWSRCLTHVFKFQNSLGILVKCLKCGRIPYPAFQEGLESRSFENRTQNLLAAVRDEIRSKFCSPSYLHTLPHLQNLPSWLPKASLRTLS